MGVLAVIITIIVAVVVLIAVGYTEIRSRNQRTDEKTNVPVVGDALDGKQDVKDAQHTTRLDEFNPQNS